MSRNTRTSRLMRGVAASIAAALLASPLLLVASAEARTPHGSLAQVILETHDVTGQPWNANLHGWWGHEGGKGDKGARPTFLSLDLSDGHGLVDDATTAAVHKALADGGDFSSMRVAFVPYSADGHLERPHVTKGETAGQAFAWFADLGVGSSMNGNTNANDFVSWVSNLAEYTKWWNAGRPVQGFTKNLNVLDISPSGLTHPSATPEGTSILNRWPAGTKISLVFYVSDGFDKAMPQMPTVKVGPDGRALTSWLTFETVASPTNPARTSGGYKVLTGAGTGPGVAARPRVAPTPAPSSGPSSGSTPSAAGGATGTSGKGSNGTSNSSFVSSLPGGKPTFFVLVLVLVAGGVALVTMRMRTAAGQGPGTPQRGDEN